MSKKKKTHTIGFLFDYLKEVNKEDEFDYKKGKILIVEDDKNIRKVIIRYLINNSYKNFIQAANGRQGLEALYEYTPDLIICDYNMPHMKGDVFHDKMLSSIGRLLKSNLRNYDLPACYGGDEFIITLPETNLKNALKVAEILRSKIKNKHIEYEGQILMVTASFGVASLRDHADLPRKSPNNLKTETVPNAAVMILSSVVTEL
ncbi:MAG: diguanylate cyclase [Spirochaetales bacterium]|nr:diguanylate cyclase [Spirochaetales bacterium]